MWSQHIQHVKAGDVIYDSLFNDIIAKIEPFSKISAATGGYLTYSTGPYGTELILLLPSDQMARLSGSSNPYAWQSVYWNGGAWVDGPALTYNGTDAYEYNGATGLDGKVVRMSWTSAGDWRFQAVRHSSDPCACVPPTSIVFHVGDGLSATMPWNAMTSGPWEAIVGVPGTVTYKNVALGGPCGSDGTITMDVRYRLFPCVLSGSVRVWRFSITFPVNSCQPVGSPAYLERRYGNPLNPQTQFLTLTSDIPFTCDYSMLVFNIPTEVSWHGTPSDPSSLGTPLPVPGGGGTITVVP